MTIVFCEHALGADYRVADLAEVLNLLVLMLKTEDLSCLGIGNGACACSSVAYSVVQILIMIACNIVLLIIFTVIWIRLHC